MSAASTAIVTGAAGGIGQAIARFLAQDGHPVALVDLNEEAVGDAARELAAEGFAVLPLAADLRRAGACDALVRQASDWQGAPPGVLVNNAGLLQRSSTEAIGLDEWNDVLGVNLTAVQAMVSAVLPGMRARGGGAVVNVASIAGLLSVPGLNAYTASKHGVIGLTRALGTDLAAYGIRVNAVAPGMVESAMTRPFFARPELRAAMERSVPLGRIGRPEDIAHVVRFLVSEGAAYVTGAVIVADGGFSAAKSYVP